MRSLLYSLQGSIKLAVMHDPVKVALLIETSNSYARELLQGIRSYLREHESWSIYLSEHGRGEGVPGWLARWKGDGIIARVENQAIAQAVATTGIPVVDVSFALGHSPFPRVVTDSQAVTRLAADHLLERGFTHFGYCGEARLHWSNLRRDSFAEEVGKAGHDCDSFSFTEPGSPAASWEVELERLAQWLGQLPKPVGIMACYDIRGQQVLEACRRSGLAVPDEVAVIGVHNDELLCDLCNPPLSSVIPNARRTGYEAAALLEQMMRGKKVAPDTLTIPPIGVAIRQSSDVVAVNDPQLSAAIRFIREHATRRIDVSDVLRAVPMSRTILERRFKKHLGCTPHEQIIKTRIARVKSMLATTDLPLALIAERTGFEHVEYLSVAFKRVVGCSPSQYRAQNKA